jgi:hypothetical protein
MLVRRSSFSRKAGVPKTGVDLDDRGFPFGNVPPIERPEVNGLTCRPAEAAEPRQPGVSRLGDRTGHVEMKYGFRSTCALLRHASPRGVANSCFPISTDPFANEVDIDVRFVGRPMRAEIIEEAVPVRWQEVSLEISCREGKGMVDADQCWGRLLEKQFQPSGNPRASPVFARREWRKDFLRR